MSEEKKSSEKNCKCKCKCGCFRKIIRRTLLGILILFVVVFVVLGIVINRLDPIVKTAVETYGPKMLGVPVTLGKVDFSVFRMRFELGDLVVGNPEGYNTDNAISVGRVLVKVQPSSLLSDTIVVQQVLVEDPVITYEVGLGNSNIGTILDNLNKGKEEKPEVKEEEPAEASKSGKKVVIDEVCVSGGQINLSAKILQGLAAPVPLPTITLNDIGRDKEEGTSFLDATSEVLGKVLTSVVDVSKEAFDKAVSLVGDAAKAIGDGAKAAAGAVKDGLKSGIDAVKDIFSNGDKEE